MKTPKPNSFSWPLSRRFACWPRFPACWCAKQPAYMTKYSFIMLLLAGLCVLLVLMINSYEHVSEQLKGGLLVKKEEELEAAKVKQQETDQKLQASQKELRALQFQMDELKAKNFRIPA